MAEAPAAENVDEANIVPNELSPVVLLYRYLHTGNVTSSVPIKQQIRLDEIEVILQFVNDMAQQNIDDITGAIKKAYIKKMYLHVDNVLVVLAYFCRQNHSNNLKTAAYALAVKLINNQSDFLAFAKYCRDISLQLRQHKGFGGGMRRMVTRWYEKYTNLELANMFGEHRGLFNTTHRSFIRKAHVRIKMKSSVAQATAVTVSVPDIALPSTSYAALSTDQFSFIGEDLTGEVSVPMPVQVPSEVQQHNKDRENVFEFLFRTGREYLQFLEGQPIGPGAQRMQQLQILKTNENVENTIQSIKHHKFTAEQMPAHLLEKSSVWETLLPSMTLTQVMKYFHTIRDFVFLNPDTEFAKTFYQECVKKLDGFPNAKVCPISVYLTMRLYDDNQRYLGTTKSKFYKKKFEKRKIQKNPDILKHLSLFLDRALSDYPPVSANYMVAIDLRSKNINKHVSRNKHVNCFEASVLLAYSLFEREKRTLIYTFSDTKDGDLIPIHPKLKHRAFTEAVEICKTMSVRRTYQSLAAPIAEATKRRFKVDVFVVVVDSVARFCRQRQVPQQEFAEYKNQFNKHAKYVVVNLARSEHDLDIPQTDEMTGFFEICGFTEDVAKLLEALGDNRFR